MQVKPFGQSISLRQEIFTGVGVGSPEAALFLISKLNFITPQIKRGMAKANTKTGNRCTNPCEYFLTKLILVTFIMSVKRSEHIIIIWLLALPLVNFMGFYEGPKVLFYLVGTIVVIIYLLLCKKQELGKLIKLPDFLFIIWLIVLSVSSFLGVHPVESFIGGSYRHQGVIFFLGLLIIMKFVELLPVKSKQLLLLGFIPIICLESLLVIAQKLFNFDLLNNRPMGTFGEPNAVAGFLVVGIYLALKAIKKVRLNKIILPFIVLAFAAIVVTGSRTALLASLFVFLGMTRPGLVKPIVIFTAIVFAFIILKNGLLVRNDSLYENRIVFWQMAVEGIKQRPLLGYGAESGEYFYNQAFAKAEMPLYQLIVDRSHNLFLDVMLWSGIVGLIVFLMWLIVSWKNGYGLIAWLVFACLQPLGVVHWILLLLIFKL